MTGTITFVVAPTHDRMRLDRVVADVVAKERPEIGATRAAVQRWIDEGRVLVSGAPARAAQKVAAGAAITVDPPPPPTTTAKPDASIAFDVLFEDEHLLVLDKPPHLVVHPARGHADGTLVNGLLAREGFDVESDDEEHLRPGIVHRLDKGTSGVMVVAKNARAREGLKALFAAHDLERSYVAVTVGVPAEGRIETLHGRHRTDRLRFTTHVDTGKRAVTEIRVLETIGEGVRACALVRATLETGRTHQIRIHLAEVRRTPVLGDPLYGGKPRDPALRAIAQGLRRQALHAETLGFVHPVTGQRLRFTTPPPRDMADAIGELRALAR